MSEVAVVTPGRTAASIFDASGQVPALYAPDAPAARRAFEFFTVNIRNPNTRKAYARAAADFATWCKAQGIADVRQVQPVHVAAHIESLRIRGVLGKTAAGGAAHALRLAGDRPSRSDEPRESLNLGTSSIMMMAKSTR